MTTSGEKIDAAIVVRDLRGRFGQHEVLKGVNLDWPRRPITTIVGPSGCGKAVLLKHLNLLLRPDSGQIIIDGIDVTKLSWASPRGGCHGVSSSTNCSALIVRARPSASATLDARMRRYDYPRKRL